MREIDVEVRIDPELVIDSLRVDDIVDYIGESDILDYIGEKRCIEYFGIETGE